LKPENAEKNTSTNNISNPSISQNNDNFDNIKKNNYFINNNYNFFANPANCKKNYFNVNNVSSDLKPNEVNFSKDVVKKNIIPVSMKVIKNNLNEKRIILKNIMKESPTNISNLNNNEAILIANKLNNSTNNRSDIKSENTSLLFMKESPIMIVKNKIKYIDMPDSSFRNSEQKQLVGQKPNELHTDNKQNEDIKIGLANIKSKMKNILDKYYSKVRIL